MKYSEATANKKYKVISFDRNPLRTTAEQFDGWAANNDITVEQVTSSDNVLYVLYTDNKRQEVERVKYLTRDHLIELLVRNCDGDSNLIIEDVTRWFNLAGGDANAVRNRSGFVKQLDILKPEHECVFELED